MKKQGNRARLRCCASCQWIYKGEPDCPKCGFASYSAKYVFGNSCYRFSITQQPWHEQKMSSYSCQLFEEIDKTNPIKKKDAFIL